MARPRTGQVRWRDNRCVATVPAGPGQGEISRSFAREDDARAWVAASWSAIDAGQPAPDPQPFRHSQRATAAADQVDDPPFAELAWAWFSEHYEELGYAKPDRADDVRRDLANHVLPFFAACRASDLEVRPGGAAHERVKDFVQHLAGRGPVQGSPAAPTVDAAALSDVVDVDEAARRTATSRSTIKRARRAGRLPHAFVEDGPHGKLRIPVSDLVAAGLLGGAASGKGLAKSTAARVLWVLNQILAYMHSTGYLNSDPSQGLAAIDPYQADAHTKPAKKKAPALDLIVCYRIAARLHPVHQLVFWLQRLLGLRISEAFGFVVDNVVDGGHDGVLAVEYQGGRWFRQRDPHGHTVKVRRKNEVKNDESHRVVGVPASLMGLIRLVREAYHTDPATGQVETGQPLVPGLQCRDHPDQQAYYTALRTALAEEGFDLESDGYRIVPQTLRKSFVTDLTTSELDGVLARRLAGHAAGTDVHDRVYVLDDPKLEPQRRAAEELDANVAREIGSVVVPTTRRPQFGTDNPLAARRHYSETVLETAYAREGDEDPLCGTDWVARELDIAPTTARRWMREDKIPTVQAAGSTNRHERLARLSDVRALRRELAAAAGLVDLAEKLGVTYHDCYRTVQRLQLDLPCDDNGRLVLDDDAAAVVRAEYDRIAALHQRTVSAATASQQLGCSLSTVYAMARRGDLTIDGETDSSGAKFITCASIDTHLARQQPAATPETVPLAKAAERTGLSTTELVRRVRAGDLEGVSRGRQWHITRRSLQRWS